MAGCGSKRTVPGLVQAQSLAPNQLSGQGGADIGDELKGDPRVLMIAMDFFTTPRVSTCSQVLAALIGIAAISGSDAPMLRNEN
jgi:hypothetical protein